ncbi:hypothetical protein PLICRDRAFT_520791 [Plicaturopsis crispa FD-325 SS-3]|nr:hypothetical protein PLICRDRAFT_520791 [Plicaturopsis crispa FD-325 SS-3]
MLCTCQCLAPRLSSYYAAASSFVSSASSIVSSASRQIAHRRTASKRPVASASIYTVAPNAGLAKYIGKTRPYEPPPPQSSPKANITPHKANDAPRTAYAAPPKQRRSNPTTPSTSLWSIDDEWLFDAPAGGKGGQIENADDEALSRMHDAMLASLRCALPHHVIRMDVDTLPPLLHTWLQNPRHAHANPTSDGAGAGYVPEPGDGTARVCDLDLEDEGWVEREIAWIHRQVTWY